MEKGDIDHRRTCRHGERGTAGEGEHPDGVGRDHGFFEEGHPGPVAVWICCVGGCVIRVGAVGKRRVADGRWMFQYVRVDVDIGSRIGPA